MSELRQDELTGRWVMFAPGRSARPHTFPAPEPRAEPPRNCPFCPGHESQTPPEVYRTGAGAPETPGWRVRVVPNLYPITAAHEVAVLSPTHDRSFAQFTDDQATEVFVVLRDRTRFHLARGATYVQSLINHGRAAGASIEHPHAQIVPLELIPPAVAYQLDHFHAHGVDPIEESAASANAGSDLAVLTGPAPVWCVAAGTSPFEFRTAYRGRASRFDDATDTEVATVAIAARDALARLAAVLGDVPYNLIVQTAPQSAAFHWYLEVQTRVSVVAGFELGTGIFVNVTPPELAAKQLREAGDS